MQRPVLLLDIMDTLVRDPFFEEVPRFFGMTLDELFAVKDRQSYLDFEHGAIDEAAHAATFFTDRRNFDLEALKRSLFESYRWMDGVPELLQALKAKNAPMYALSNYSSWYRMIEDKLGVSRFLDWRFVSCETGVRKPQPESYLGAARALGVAPEDCLFVDDRAKNVEGARAVGMKAILRTPQIEDLRGALREHGAL